MTAPKYEAGRRPLAWRLSVATLLAALVAAVGYFVLVFVPAERAQAVDRWRAQLSAMADDRKAAVDRWLVEGLGHARTVSDYPSVRHLVAESRAAEAGPDSAKDSSRHLRLVLAAVVANGSYRGAAVLDVKGRTLIVAGVDPRVGAEGIILVRGVLDTGQPRADLLRHFDSTPLVHFAAPIRADVGGSLIGAALLMADPETWLYPFLRHQPLASRTEETLLVRRDGERVLFLSPLRDIAVPPLSLRLPLATRRAGDAAIEGSEGFGEYIDYHGDEVLAATRRLANAPWGLVAKVDRDEALASARSKIRVVAGALFVLLTGLVAAFMGAWLALEARARARLASAKARFSILLDQASDAILLVGADGRIRDANQRAVELYGYPRQDLCGLHVSLLRHDRSRDEVDRRSADIQQRGERVWEAVHVTREGRELPVEVAARAVELDGQRFNVTIIRDVAERRRTEQALRESEARYRTLFEANQDAVILGLVDGPILDANPAATAMFGWSLDEMRRINTNDLLDRDALGLREALEDLARKGRVGGLLRLRRRGGTLFDAEVSSVLIPSQGGDVRASLVVRDVTERRQTEEAVRASEARFRALFDNMLEGFAYCRMVFEDGVPVDFVYVDVNVAFEKLTGLANVVGRRVSEVIPEVRQTNPQMFEACGRVAATGIPEHFETYIPGTHFWFSVSAYRPEPEHFVAVFENVTERKRSELALRASHQLIEEIINAIPAGVFWKDTNLVYLGCNTAFARDAGFEDPKDVVGKDDYQMAWRDQAGLYRSDDRRVIESGRARVLVEEPHTTAEGNIITVLTSKTPLRNSQGEVTGVLGTYMDLTELKHAEEALRASESRYRRLFESAKDGILILDAETGIVVDVNPFLLELLSFSRDAVLGKKVWDLGFLKDVLANEANFLELQQTKYLRYEDLPLQTSDGRRIDVEFVSNVYRVNGETVIQCNIRDISKRKRAEESHMRLSTAVEQSDETIVITDIDGSILYANPAFERTSGYTLSEAIGQNPRLLKSGKQDAEFYRQMWTVLSHGRVWSGHFINKRKDGTLFEENATISPVRDAAGHIVNYVAVKRDVTNEMRLERQLMQAQKMEAVGRLAGGVAHDFNNLLGVITGYGEITLQNLRDDDPLKAKVDQILKAAERAAGLTRQLLAFSRQQVLEPRIVDLNVLVSDVEKLLRRLIGEDVLLEAALEPGLGNVKADPGQVEQVLMNLAVNARDAMPDGGRLTIETRNVDIGLDVAADRFPIQAGRYVMLVVTDTGMGMDAETQSHVFEPFFTTKEVGKGTGLGLSTVYGIVKQSEGHIWCHSEVGVGTTFKIYLPWVDEDASPSLQPTEYLPKRGSETVLLIEDDPSLRDLLREILETAGYTVLVAQDGATALSIADEYAGAIHLIITDVIMPGLTGRQAAEKIRSTRSEVRILFISGYTNEAIARHGVLSSEMRFLSKPFTSIDLLRKIRDVLEGR